MFIGYKGQEHDLIYIYIYMLKLNMSKIYKISKIKIKKEEDIFLISKFPIFSLLMTFLCFCCTFPQLWLGPSTSPLFCFFFLWYDHIYKASSFLNKSRFTCFQVLNVIEDQPLPTDSHSHYSCLSLNSLLTATSFDKSHKTTKVICLLSITPK